MNETKGWLINESSAYTIVIFASSVVPRWGTIDFIGFVCYRHVAPLGH